MERYTFNEAPTCLNVPGPAVLFVLSDRSAVWQDLHGRHLGYSTIEHVDYADTLAEQRLRIA